MLVTFVSSMLTTGVATFGAISMGYVLFYTSILYGEKRVPHYSNLVPRPSDFQYRATQH